MRGCNDLEHGGHADRIRTERAEHANLRRCLKLRAVYAAVYTLMQLKTAVRSGLQGFFTELMAVGERHIRKTGTEFRIVFAGQRTFTGHVDVVGDQHKIARMIAGVDAAGGIRHDKRLHAQCLHHINRIRHLVRRVALVAVQTALHADNTASGQRAAYHASCVVRRGGYLKMRNLAVRYIRRVLHLISQRADARAEHQCDFGHKRQLFFKICCRFRYICFCQHRSPSLQPTQDSVRALLRLRLYLFNVDGLEFTIAV